MVLPEGVPLKARVGLPQKVRRHGQVDLRADQADMPEVNGEVINKPLHVRSLPVPFRQPMDGKGVPKIMHPRLEA